MLPIGSLMIEHRLIERMVSLVEFESRKITETKKVNPVFIDTVIDFFRAYADRCHHGKEEDILFRELAAKELSTEHRTLMNELIEEHVIARKTVSRLENAKESNLKDEVGSLNEISRNLNELTELYPKHIFKEDKTFFYPCMKYFTKNEQDKMLQEFTEFDKEINHERYRKTVAEMEKAQHKTLKKYRCSVCNYIYDPEVGDSAHGIAPGVAFENLPENWVCPICGAPKTKFEKIQ
jgi:hemerythrin-like domain-containing protein/rubredoxin